ncbi:hypothetical protein [Sphingosinicella sp. BN140058]|uniref:hypothetical protein n=1 Tax=Sphingosinicella sp. BN140058 TaxID=1892855 RepID=UPI0010126D83|nr:hypothetical protein [Sphingosinicella sp. BN140058]QAY80444.1 hypothetical protein ETR14_27785 [Sphingosinicella sp. BN140058]
MADGSVLISFIKASYRPVGVVTVWTLIGLTVLALLGLAYLTSGYIYGAVRQRRRGILRADTPWWALILIGLERLCGKGGDFCAHRGERVYHFGFARVEKDEIWTHEEERGGKAIGD